MLTDELYDLLLKYVSTLGYVNTSYLHRFGMSPTMISEFKSLLLENGIIDDEGYVIDRSNNVSMNDVPGNFYQIKKEIEDYFKNTSRVSLEGISPNVVDDSNNQSNAEKNANQTNSDYVDMNDLINEKKELLKEIKILEKRDKEISDQIKDLKEKRDIIPREKKRQLKELQVRKNKIVEQVVNLSMKLKKINKKLENNGIFINDNDLSSDIASINNQNDISSVHISEEESLNRSDNEADNVINDNSSNLDEHENNLLLETLSQINILLNIPGFEQPTHLFEHKLFSAKQYIESILKERNVSYNNNVDDAVTANYGAIYDKLCVNLQNIGGNIAYRQNKSSVNSLHSYMIQIKSQIEEKFYFYLGFIKQIQKENYESEDVINFLNDNPQYSDFIKNLSSSYLSKNTVNEKKVRFYNFLYGERVDVNSDLFKKYEKYDYYKVDENLFNEDFRAELSSIFIDFEHYKDKKINMDNVQLNDNQSVNLSEIRDGLNSEVHDAFDTFSNPLQPTGSEVNSNKNSNYQGITDIEQFETLNSDIFYGGYSESYQQNIGQSDDPSVFNQTMPDIIRESDFKNVIIDYNDTSDQNQNKGDSVASESLSPQHQSVSDINPNTQEDLIDFSNFLHQKNSFDQLFSKFEISVATLSNEDLLNYLTDNLDTYAGYNHEKVLQIISEQLKKTNQQLSDNGKLDRVALDSKIQSWKSKESELSDKIAVLQYEQNDISNKLTEQFALGAELEEKLRTIDDEVIDGETIEQVESRVQEIQNQYNEAIAITKQLLQEEQRKKEKIEEKIKIKNGFTSYIKNVEQEIQNFDNKEKELKQRIRIFSKCIECLEIYNSNKKLNFN